MTVALPGSGRLTPEANWETMMSWICMFSGANIVSVFQPLLANTVRVFESYGLDAEALFAADGIRFRLPLDPSARISRKKFLQVRRRAMKLSGDPYYPLRMAQVFHPGDVGVLGFAWLASSNLRECFLRLERFSAMISDGISVAVTDEPPNMVVSYVPDFGLEPEQLTSIAAGACFLQLSRDHRKKPFKLTEMKFACKKPTRIAGFRKFFDCPLSFGHKVNQLVMPLAVADEPIPQSNRQLAKLHDEIIDGYLDQMGRKDIVGRVRTEIMRQLPAGSMTIDTVSASLQYSSRTLRRRLKERNETFTRLVAQVRKELVGQYMADRSLLLFEISFMLGFSEQSAFSRAYKRWFGVSPKMARNPPLTPSD
jgi:AraC-like DNA-binding protein